MAKESVVMSYFDNLEHCLRKHNLTNKPHLIYNIDEKGVSIEHRPPYIVACTFYIVLFKECTMLNGIG